MWTKLVRERFYQQFMLKNGHKILSTMMWTLSVVLATNFIPSIALALTVSPTLIEHKAKAGQDISDSIRLYNETDQTLVIRVEIQTVDLESKNESGLPMLIPAQPKGLSSWISLGEEVIALSPAEYHDVPFTITVPDFIDPGGYYAAILFSAIANSSDPKTIQVISKTGPLIFLTVSGEFKKEAALLKFGFKDDLSGHWFSRHPEGFAVKIQNTGTAHLKPAGVIELFGNVGRERLLPINKEGRMILPGWTRSFENDWIRFEKGGWFHWLPQGLIKEWQGLGFGRYLASLTLVLGDSVASQELSYWVVPWRTMLLISLFTFLILLPIRRSKR